MKQRSRLARMLAVMALLMMSMGIGSARPASALGCDSRKAPDPRSPRSGPSALLAEPPAKVPTGDPFRKDATATELYDKYGTAGLWWPVYDPGCNPASEWGMRNTTGLAQYGLEAQNFFLNASAAVRSWAWRSDWLQPLDDSMTSFTKSTQGNYAAPMMGIALVAAGALIAFRGRKAALSQSATLAAWAVGMMVLGVFALSAPTKAARIVDYYGAGTAQAIETTMTGHDAEPSNETRPPDAIDRPGNGDGLDVPELTRKSDPFVALSAHEIGYQNWLVGMFGSADSPTAKEYGPRFYKAMALSWDEAELPSEERKLVEEQKRTDFKDAAEELRDEDPSAFKVMQGKTAFQDRVMTGWVSALLTGIVTFFGFIAAICVLLARLVIRFGVMALPIVIPFGMVHSYRQPVLAVLKLVAGGVLTAVMFTLASGLTVRLVSSMLKSTMPLLLVVVIALGLTILLMTKLKTGHVLKTLVGLRVAKNLSSPPDRSGSDDDGPAEVIPSRRESHAVPMPPLAMAGTERTAAAPTERAMAALPVAAGVIGDREGEADRRTELRPEPLKRVVNAAGTGPIIDTRAVEVTDRATRPEPRDPVRALQAAPVPHPMPEAEATSSSRETDADWAAGDRSPPIAAPAGGNGTLHKSGTPPSVKEPAGPDAGGYYVPTRLPSDRTIDPSAYRHHAIYGDEPAQTLVYDDHVAEVLDGHPVVYEFRPDPERARPPEDHGGIRVRRIRTPTELAELTDADTGSTDPR